MHLYKLKDHKVERSEIKAVRAMIMCMIVSLFVVNSRRRGGIASRTAESWEHTH